MQTLSESDVRRIIREELVAMLGVALRRPRPRPIPAAFDPAEDVARFAATLQPGERVPAAEFYGRWKAWAETDAPGAAGLTMTAFGRLAARCDGLSRSGVSRRFYMRRFPGRPGCVGAPDCHEPMLKMSDRCAGHQA